MTDQELLKSLESLKATMISVATGGPRIDEVKSDFADLYDQVSRALEERKIEFPVPYRDLWQWYGRWSEEDLRGWAPRRKFVGELFEPVMKHVRLGAVALPEPTGWDRVDRAMAESWRRLAAAKTEEQFQAVGLLCREILISLGQAVFDAQTHPTLDGKVASSTDAKRMLEAYIAVVLDHEANEYVRKHARAALDLAVNLQHKRTADYRDTAICVEATGSVVSLVAILDGRRNRLS